MQHSLTRILLAIVTVTAIAAGTKGITYFVGSEMRKSQKEEAVDIQAARVLDEWKKNRVEVRREVDAYVSSFKGRLPLKIKGFHTLVQVKKSKIDRWPKIYYIFQLSEETYWTSLEREERSKIFKQQVLALFCSEKTLRFGDKYEVSESYFLETMDTKSSLASASVYTSAGMYKSLCLER